MNKVDVFCNKVVEIINWAEYQGHINEEGASILIQNILDAKADMNIED